MPEEKKFAPVLPYDSTFGEHFTTYDTAPYSCDRDHCYSMITKTSGNVVKYYECQTEEPVEIAAKDTL